MREALARVLAGDPDGRVYSYTRAMAPPQTLPPRLVTAVPGPRSRELATRLARVESRNVTCLDPAPIFWERAAGANVWDVDGNRFVDLDCRLRRRQHRPRASRHRGRRCVIRPRGCYTAWATCIRPPVKVELLEALARLFRRRSRARLAGRRPDVLGSSGADAVESALKTAMLATGRAGVVAFEGAYHGLSLGALDATWRADFREPFAARLPGCTAFAASATWRTSAGAAQRCSGTRGRRAGRADPGPRRRARPARGFLRGCARSAIARAGC